MNDSSIIELFFARKEEGISAMDSKYGRLCYSVAYNVLSNSEEADEAVNTAYMKLWNSIPPARPKSLCGYICTTVRNAAIDALNRLKKHSADDIYDELAEIIPDSRTIESEYDSREISTLINEFLDTSDKTARSIFTARYYLNMPIADIAEAAGMTEGAVKTRLSRMRNKLRAFLSERGVEV